MKTINSPSAQKLINAGYQVLPPIDPEQNPARPGLEGPFRMRNGRVIYYDAKEGKYYDPRRDMYLEQDEADQLHGVGCNDADNPQTAVVPPFPR